MARSDLDQYEFTVTYHPKRKQAWQCVCWPKALEKHKTFKSNSAESVLRAAIDWADGVMI